jgi:hypothetical protein
MPKAAMHEYREFSGLVRKIGLAWKIANIQPVFYTSL